MLVDTPNRTTHYTRTSYTTEVRFTGGECYFTQQHVCLLSGLRSSLFLRSFCLISWLERVGRPVIVLPLFFATGSACHFGSSCPLFLYPSSTFPPQLSLPPPFSTLPIGPASHCGWSRLSSISPPSLALTTTLSHYLGPACHCGRSRLVSPPFYLSTSHIHTTLISITLLTYIPLPLHPFWPGLSLWQVPPTPPISNTLQHFLPLHPPTITLPYLHLPLRYIVARLVIVAGPAISSYPGTSLTPPSLLFPLPTSTYKPTPPPLQATGPACHCGWSRLSHLHILSLPSIHTPHLLLSYLGPAYHCGRSRPS